MCAAVALTVCSASAVTTLPCRSIPPSTVVAIGTSLVFAPTSVWAATTALAGFGPAGPTSAASRCTWLPSASLAPRAVLPSSRTWPIACRACPPSPAGPAASAARPLTSQVPATVSKTSGSASVSTRQIVDFDGGPAGVAPALVYSSASTPAGTSATQPVIAVYPLIPATTAAAASASTTATGWSRPCPDRPSETCANSSSRSVHACADAAEPSIPAAPPAALLVADSATAKLQC